MLRNPIVLLLGLILHSSWRRDFFLKEKSSSLTLTSKIPNRTTGVSIFRLRELDKRFRASAGDRYELAILAVMCSVIEANLTIICANLPTLGYKVFSDWFGRHVYGGVYAGDLRQLTIGNGSKPVDIRRGDLHQHTADPVCVGRDIELDDTAEHHRRYGDTVLDFSIFELPSDVRVRKI